MFRNLSRHLEQLFVFRGRENARTFWPFAGIVLVAGAGAMMMAMVPQMLSTFSRVARFAREHPDQVTETRGPGSYEITVHGYHPELVPDFNSMIGGVSVIVAAVVVLLAAATARRLHDGGRSGLWGLLPLPFLIGGLGLMSRLFAGLRSLPDLPMELFGLSFAVNLIYLATLGILVFLLARPSDLGPNRHGPQPDM